MINIKLTKDMVLRAYKDSISLGECKNSILRGKGNFTGFVGEEAVKSYLKIESQRNNTYNYDITYNSISLDVKAKKTSVIPQSYHEASIANFNTKQNCKYYVFTRVLWPQDMLLPISVYIMGYYDKKEYMKEARFLKKGQVDGSNNFVVKADCWNMLYSDLLDFSQFKEKYQPLLI
jgi:hypothetical protein